MKHLSRLFSNPFVKAAAVAAILAALSVVCHLAAPTFAQPAGPGAAPPAQSEPEEEIGVDELDVPPELPPESAATAPATSAPGNLAESMLAPASAPSSAPAGMAATAPSSMPALAPSSMPAVLPLPPGGKMVLNFRDASLRAVTEYLSAAAGFSVVEEAAVRDRITLVSRQGVTADEAVSLLDTALRAKGYAAIRNGRVLRIVSLEQARKDLVPVRVGNDPQKIQAGDRVITQIIPIRSADATRLKADLASLIPSTADVTSNASSNTLIVTANEATVRRLVEIIQAIDVQMSEVTQVRVWQLKYANAANAARLITDIFREDQPTQQTAGAFGGGRRAFTFPGAAGAAGGAVAAGGAGTTSGADQRRAPRVTASSDDRTNTLVVSAAPDVLKVIEGVVKELDANPAETQAVFIYRLRNAQAANLEGVLNNLFGWTGSSASRTQTTAGGQTRTTGNTSTFGTSGRTGSTGSTGGRGLSSSSGTTGGGFGSSRTGTTTTGGRTGTTLGSAGGRGVSASTAAAASDLAGQVYVVADADTNALLVTTASKNFERVKAIIAELDRAVPQVLIKVLIAEVTHDNSLDLGLEFSGFNLRPSGSGFKVGTDFNVAAKQTGFTFRLDEANVSAALRMIAGKATLDVLSRPYILTADNQQASIMVGEEVPFITRSTLTEAGQQINTIEYDDIGIILNVTPHINPQGLVTLDVAPEISTLTGTTVPISETVSAPVFAKRSAYSRVAVRDGQTIVIGGLMEDRNTTSVDKVPVLGDVPLLGLLFQRTITAKTKTELLIFLTPHVALEPDDLERMGEDERAGAKILLEAVEKGALKEHLEGMKRGAASRPAGSEPQTVTIQEFSTQEPSKEPSSDAPTQPPTLPPPPALLPAPEE